MNNLPPYVRAVGSVHQIADDVSSGICPERLKAAVKPLSLVAFF